MTEFVIIGAGGHAASVAEAILSGGNFIKGFVDETGSKSRFLGYPVFKSVELVIPEGGNIVVAVGDNFLRKAIVERLTSARTNSFPPVVHSTAYVASNATIQEGVVILAFSHIGPASKVGAFSLLNTRSSIDHDCVLEEFSSLAPSAVTGGNVTIGQQSAVGIGATVSHRIVVGGETVIGGGSFVFSDVPSNVVAYGTPCKVVRSRSEGAQYL